MPYNNLDLNNLLYDSHQESEQSSEEIDLKSCIVEIDLYISKYLEDIDCLWENVILEYKNNLQYGLILQNATKEKFYELMISTPTFRFLNDLKNELSKVIH